MVVLRDAEDNIDGIASQKWGLVQPFRHIPA